MSDFLWLQSGHFRSGRGGMRPLSPGWFALRSPPNGDGSMHGDRQHGRHQTRCPGTESEQTNRRTPRRLRSASLSLRS